MHFSLGLVLSLVYETGTFIMVIVNVSIHLININQYRNIYSKYIILCYFSIFSILRSVNQLNQFLFTLNIY